MLEKSILEPLKLRILILSGTGLTGQELESIQICKNLLKLDISQNQIKCFPDSLSFSNLSQLRLLYLHENLIEESGSLKQVFEIPNLRYLTLFNNPIYSKGIMNLRELIVNSMPSLFALDSNAIGDNERSQHVLIFFHSPPHIILILYLNISKLLLNLNNFRLLNEQISRTDRFFVLSPSTQLRWPLVVNTPQNNVICPDEDYLKIMHNEIYIINKKFNENSPITMM